VSEKNIPKKLAWWQKPYFIDISGHMVCIINHIKTCICIYVGKHLKKLILFILTTRKLVAFLTYCVIPVLFPIKVMIIH